MICDAPPEQMCLMSLMLTMMELETLRADWFLFSRDAAVKVLCVVRQ